MAICIPLSAGVAGADPSEVVCAGTDTVTYSPGLTLVPTSQAVHAETSYAPCVVPGNPAVTPGQVTVNFPQVRSCLGLLDASSGAVTITWNTGQTSLFTFDRTVIHVGETQCSPRLAASPPACSPVPRPSA
jgi:hypothetical protein